MDTGFVVAKAQSELIENDCLIELDIYLPILKPGCTGVWSGYKK